MKRMIPAGTFKAQCLKIMDEVQAKKQSIVITKHKEPVAQLIPIQEEHKKALFGKMRGTLHIKGDIIKPIGEEWDACS